MDGRHPGRRSDKFQQGQVGRCGAQDDAGVSGWLTKRYLDAGLFFAKGTILDKAKAAIDAAAQQVNAGPPEKRSG